MIKNLKVYSRKVGKKLKLQLCSICLSVVLIVSGCSFNNKNNSTNVNSNEVKVENNFDLPSNKDYELDELSKKIINSKLKLSNIDVNNSINNISSIDVDYELSELYGIDKFFNAYNELNYFDSSIENGKVIKNNNVDLKSLYEVVLKNNEEYLINNSELKSKYNDNSDSFIYVVCGVLSNYLNDYIKSNSSIDINSLDYKLSNLKIFDSDTFSYAYYNPDTNILGISTATINSVKSTSGDEEAFEKVIEHEGSHIIQAGIDKEYLDSDYSMRFGPCYKFNNLEVNCGYWDWFFEATAESLVSKYHDTNNSLTYSYNIKFLEMLKIATIINDNNNVYSLEKFSNQNDLEVIFKYFSCNNIEDKKEVVKMMYAFNIISMDTYNSSTNDFYDIYEEKNGIKMDYNSRYYLGIKLSSNISATISKIFYKNLYNTLKDKEVVIEDVFQNIMVLENEFSRFLKYYETGRFEYIEDFFLKYTEMQETLFSDISDCLGISVDDVRDAYIKYNANTRNANISYFDENKNSFCNYILESRVSYKEVSIYDVYDNLKHNIIGEVKK